MRSKQHEPYFHYRLDAMHKICPVCSKEFTIRRGSPKQKTCSFACGHSLLNHTPEKVLAVFWTRVNKNGPNGCWLWTGYKNEKGYGLMSVPHLGTRSYRAHRYSWELVHGPTPSHRFCLHKCDTPACVNPDHLHLGSYRENTLDAISRGRDVSVGERNRRAILTEKEVLAIRADYKRIGLKAMTAKYPKVSSTTIYQAASGRTWKHLNKPSAL